MKNIYKFKLLLLLTTLFLNVTIFSQQRTIDLQATQSNVSGIYEARDEVTLKDGYIFSAQTNQSMEARVNDQLLFDVDYLEGTEIPDPATYTPSKSLDVGTTAGALDVSSSGAATYTIPISCPPGVGKMAPQISITYNSQAGNGIAGWGFNIAGISAIKRVAQDIYRDGNAHGISFDNNDRFALDGNRLIVQNSGTYGADGSIYRTEDETFVIIKSHGTSSPEWFEVTDKNGTTFKYGSSTGKLTYNSTTTIIWFLDYVEDVFGNYITYNYEQIGQNTYLKNIEYGKNKNDNVQSSSTFTFIYENREDLVPIHYGTLQKDNIDQILSQILVKSDGNLYRKYTFEYSKDIYSRLTKVTESNGIEENLNPLVFNWGAINSTISVTNPTILPSTLHQVADIDKSWISADFTGDGISDLIGFYAYTQYGITNNYMEVKEGKYTSGNGIEFGAPPIQYFTLGKDFLIPENQFVWEAKKWDVGTKEKSVLLGDINGDKATDVITLELFKNPDNTYKIKYDCITKQSSDLDVDLAIDGSKMPLSIASDVNNDGFDDLVLLDINSTSNNYKLNIIRFENDGSGWGITRLPTYQTITLGKIPEKLLFVDYNSDGMKDILIFNADGFSIFKNLGNDAATQFSQTADYSSTSIIAGDALLPGDFNGDGFIDFFYRKSSGSDLNQWYLAINQGDYSFSIVQADNEYRNSGDKVVIMDFNNDGKSDIVYYFHYRSIFNYSWYSSLGESFQLKKSNTTTVDGTTNLLVGDFNCDGLTDILNYGLDLYNGGEGTSDWYIYSSQDIDFKGGKITSIIDGLGNKSTISYTSLPMKQNYSADDEPNYPLSIASPAIHIVNTITNSNGVSDPVTISYTYQDAYFHTLFGFMGFGEAIIKNNLTNESVENSYGYDLMLTPTNHLYKPFLSYSTKIEASTPYIYEEYEYNKTNSYTGTGKFIYPDIITIKDYHSKSITVINKDIDNDGNLTFNETITYDLNEVEVARKTENYNNYTDIINDNNTFTNAPNEIIVEQSHADDLETITNKTTLEYNDNGTLKSKTAFADKTVPVKSTYTYNTRGNTESIITSASEMTDRWTSTVYDPTGRFIVKQTNALNHSGETTYNIWGQPLWTRDANGLISTNKYDNWGRLTEAKAPDKNIQKYVTKWVTTETEAPTGAVYYTETYNDNELSPGNIRIAAEYFDRTGRSLRKVGYGYNGVKLYADITYNTKGLIVTQTDPYPAGTTASLKTTYTYDGINRLSTAKSPTQITTTYNYFDLAQTNKISQTLSTGETFTKIYDAAGLLKESTDKGGTIKYYYTSTGQVQKIESPGGVTSTHYNEYAQQDTLYDPNKGKISYAYNNFGELIKQIDGKKKKTEIVYDILGRVKTSTCEGATTTYNYDATKALGLIQSITATGKASSEFEYDELCRVKKEKRSLGSEIFTYQYEYDTKSRLNKLTYPAGLVLTYNYNNYDDVTEIYNQTNPASPVSVWKLDEVNTKGSITKATYGNTKQITLGYDTYDRLNSISVPDIIGFNYTFNTKNQLMNRNENGVSENFTYDMVNRLETVLKGSVQELNMIYHETQSDRIRNKSDIGEYVYADASKNHKLENVNTIPGVVLPKHDITYTPEGRTATLTQTADGIATKVATFTYGVDDQRFSMEYKEGSTVKYTRYYFGSYEKEVDATGTLKRHLSYIYAPTGLIAIYEQTTSTEKMHYIYTDYLGSLRCVTDADGNIEQQMSYDAWGRRRSATTGAPFITTHADFMFARGYIGQEHLDEFGLINLNARIYDPALGVFLSPDDYITAPDFSQSYNPYAYCWNNPMMFADPSGNSPVTLIAIGGMLMFGGTALTIIGVEYNISELQTIGPIVSMAGTVMMGFGFSSAALPLACAGNGYVCFASNLLNGGDPNMGFLQGVGSGLALAGLKEGLKALGSIKFKSPINAGKEPLADILFDRTALGREMSDLLKGNLNVPKLLNTGALATTLAVPADRVIKEVTKQSNNATVKPQNTNNLTNHSSNRAQSNSGRGWDSNGDGILSLGEANWWYRNGNGQPITVNASKIDLSHVDPKRLTKDVPVPINLLTTGPASVGLVYGSVDLVYRGNNLVNIQSNEYDFSTGAQNGFPWSQHLGRNLATVIGNIVAGSGHPYMINFSGFGILNFRQLPPLNIRNEALTHIIVW